MNKIKNKRKSFLKKIWGFCEAIITILIIFICLIILIQRTSNNEKSLLGYRLFRIESGSMVPKYEINDVILVKEIDKNQIKVGDDLVYIGTYGDATGKVITHQVLEKKVVNGKNEFYTKGLANSTVDPVVKEEQVLGIVQREVYTLTLITNLLLNIYSLYFFIILPIILKLFFSALHSSERKERYIKNRIKEESKEIEIQKKKDEITNKLKGKSVQQSKTKINKNSK